MLIEGPAKKVTVYIGEDARHGGEPLYLRVLNLLFEHGVAGATVVKGIAGFGADHHLHTARLLELSGNLPVTIEFVERGQNLETVLDMLLPMVGEELVVLCDVEVIRHTPRPDGPTPRGAA
jgi:PII-like signaling protein